MIRSSIISMFIILFFVPACLGQIDLSAGYTPEDQAQEEKVTEDAPLDKEAFNDELETIKNPFVSQLPKPIVEPPVSVKVEPASRETYTPPVAFEPSPQHEPERPPVIPPTLDIQGLVWNTHRPQAIINDQIFEIGDTIAQAKIIGVEKSGVKIIYQEKEFLLPVKESWEEGATNSSGDSRYQRN